MTKLRDVIIIGSGIAGTAAALHASQAGLNVLALSKPNDPGYWTRVKYLHHFPGLQDNTSGHDLIKRTREQAERFGAAFQDLEVKDITITEKHTYQIISTDTEPYEAPAVILASGVSKDEHFLVGERELVGKGVFYSVPIDAPFLKHSSVVIIGKSEEAALATLDLARFADKIFFVIPSSKLDISEPIFRELETNRKIEMFFSSSIKKINGTDEVDSVLVLCSGTEREIKARAAFIYTYNLLPCSNFAKNVLETDKDSGRVLVNADFSTSRPGIFACGEILTGELQNPVITTAQGIIAAMNVEKFLSS